MTRQRNMAQINKTEISNLSDAEFKTLAIRMLKELSEDLNGIKKIQSETKDTLIEIKKNLQGNNSRVMKPRIKSMIWKHKEAKNNQSEKKVEKKSKKIRTV